MSRNSLWVGILLLALLTSWTQSGDDELLKQKLRITREASLPETAVQVAMSFLGTPYVAHTLESPEEHLVVNVRQLDCTTFVENVLALARTIQDNERTADAFRRNLTQCRYRGGVIQGYGSRLHYFSSFLGQLVERGEAELVYPGDRQAYDKPINFMSGHRQLYPSLGDSTAYRLTLDAERKLLTTPRFFIPKDRIREDLFRPGDIVGITSSIKGLDVSHEGFAVRKAGRIYLLHASSEKGKVMLTAEPLTAYLRQHPAQTGIMVARLR